MKIIYKGGNIRLTVVLENIGDFIYQLKTILDKRGKSDVYDEKKTFNFFKTASYSDESWDRVYSNIKYLLILVFSSLYAPMALAFFGVAKVGLLTFMGALAPVVGYIISEIVLGSKVSKRIINGELKLMPRDKNKENKITRIYTTASTVLYILLVIILQ